MCKIRSISYLLLILTPLLLVSCTKEQEEATPIIRPVRYQQVFTTGGSRLRTFSGTAQAGIQSDLSFKVAGTVKQVLVNVGDVVRKGQLLAELDPSDYRLQVQEAEAAMEQAMAQARNAKSQYDRVRDLYETRNASKSELDAARAGNESADAAVRSIEKRLELAQLQVSYTRLLAPVDGSIAAVSVDANENVQPGKPIATLTSGKQPEVKVNVPEVMIAQIRSGDKAKVSFGAIPGEEYQATVTEVGVSSTGFQTTFPVTVQLEKATEKVRPGMAAEVAIKLESAGVAERILVLPVCVGEDRHGKFVYIVEPADEGFGTVHRKEVVVGELTSDGLEILQGLVDGDLVVTAGISKLTDGLKVKLL